MYQKIGMFGRSFTNGSLQPEPFVGDQIRGVGFNHDGVVPDLFTFISAFDESPVNPVGIPVTPEGATAKKNMEQFMLAFDSNLAPIVGQQITLTSASSAVVNPRINLLRARADVGECDLVAKGRVNNETRGFLYIGAGLFMADTQSISPTDDAELRAAVVATGGMLTYTCTPPGSGVRIGIDRDLDGTLDGDE